MLRTAVVRNDCLFVLRLESVELASEFAERCFGVTDAKRAGFFERAQGRGNTGKGSFVGCDVEVRDCMCDEL